MVFIWFTLRVSPYSLIATARAWLDHFIETLLSQDCPGSFTQSLKSPTIFYSSDFETALDLHVDDGYMTGPAERMMQVFAYLEGVIVLKLSPIIGVGDSFDVGSTTKECG